MGLDILGIFSIFYYISDTVLRTLPMGLILSLWQFREALWVSIYSADRKLSTVRWWLLTQVTQLMCEWVWPQSLYLGLYTEWRHKRPTLYTVRGARTFSSPRCFSWPPSNVVSSFVLTCLPRICKYLPKWGNFAGISSCHIKHKHLRSHSKCFYSSTPPAVWNIDFPPFLVPVSTTQTMSIAESWNPLKWH